jgi:uncharacterized protein
MNDSPYTPPDSPLSADEIGLQASSKLLWNSPRCGVIDIRITAEGVWLHEGRPIQRPALVRLFASILQREADGQFYLVTPAEKMLIQVDDCPFVAVLLQVTGDGQDAVLTFELNTGEHVTANALHPLWVEEREGGPHPLLQVREGLHARLTRAVFYQLTDLAQEDTVNGTSTWVVWSHGQRFALGTTL